MINTETIIFIDLLRKLAEKSKEGIYPFSTATKGQSNGILYDDRKPYLNGDTNDGTEDSYKVIADYLIDDQHHDIISTYTDMYESKDIVIEAITDDKYDESGNWIKVTSWRDPDFCVVIEDGHWYCV